MTRIELRSKVGPDGVLSIRVPVGMAEANREVRVTVEPAAEEAPEREALVAAYGSCADLGLEEPTKDQIRAAVLSPYYEISQLFGAWCYAQRTTDVLRNACLESALIHVRALRDFFEKNKRTGKHQDLLACDFGSPSSPVGLPNDVNERLDKDLAHMTYQSVDRDGVDKVWTVGMIQPLIKRCREFIDHMLKDHRWLDGEWRAKWGTLATAFNDFSPSDSTGRSG